MRNPWFVVLICALGLGLIYGRAVQKRPALQVDDPGPAIMAAGRAVVRVAVADLLSRPQEDASVADQARLGDTLLIRGAAGGGRPYLEVETVSRYRAYARTTDLLPLSAGTPPYGTTGRLAEVRSRFANLYEKPDVTLRNPVIVAPLGVRLQVEADVDDRWLAAILPDTRRIFVQRGDVTEVGTPQRTVPCVLDHAQRYTGTPYLWGGRSTFGVDCSGLVTNALLACGVTPPRDADQQYEWNELVPVARTDIRPGDLIFFGKQATQRTPQRVTHVGIAVAADRFVHATTTDRPQVQESLFNTRWQDILVGVRRHPGLAPDQGPGQASGQVAGQTYTK